jgi:uncharacterized protein (DUF433 family)
VLRAKRESFRFEQGEKVRRFRFRDFALDDHSLNSYAVLDRGNKKMKPAMIVQRKTVLNGRPAIAGTRISVDHISTYVSNGYGVEEIQKAYPHLTDEQIAAALSYLDFETYRRTR